jgi:preprotein translocase subunit SecG
MSQYDEQLDAIDASAKEGCEQPKQQAILDNLQDVLDSVGADTQCERDSFFNSVSGSASIKGPLGMGSAKAQFQSHTSEFSESGCTPLFVQSLDRTVRQNNMNCIINNSESSTTVDVSNVNTVRFETLPPTDTLVTVINQTLAIPDLDQATKDKLVGVLSNDIIITDSTVSIDSTNNISTSIDMNTIATSELQTNYESMLTDAVETEITQDKGVAALSPDQKTIIQNRIQNEQDNTQKIINETLTSANVELGNNNDIIFKSSGDVIITNTDIGISSLSEVVTKSLTSNVLTQGAAIAASIVTDSSTKSEFSSFSRGVDSAIDSTYAGMANFHKTGLGQAIIAIVAVVVIGGIVMTMVKGGGSDGSGGSGGSDGNAASSSYYGSSPKMAAMMSFLWPLILLTVVLLALYFAWQKFKDSLNPFSMIGLKPKRM